MKVCPRIRSYLVFLIKKFVSVNKLIVISNNIVIMYTEKL